jgi:hypothetical protein
MQGAARPEVMLTLREHCDRPGDLRLPPALSDAPRLIWSALAQPWSALAQPRRPRRRQRVPRDARTNQAAAACRRRRATLARRSGWRRIARRGPDRRGGPPRRQPAGGVMTPARDGLRAHDVVHIERRRRGAHRLSARTVLPASLDEVPRTGGGRIPRHPMNSAERFQRDRRIAAARATGESLATIADARGCPSLARLSASARRRSSARRRLGGRSRGPQDPRAERPSRRRSRLPGRRRRATSER